MSRCKRAQLFSDLGIKEEAMHNQTRSIEINPQVDYFYLERKYVLNELGRKEEDIKDFMRATKDFKRASKQRNYLI